MNADTKEKKQNVFEIDAAGQKVGRVASEAVKYLMGKNSPDYSRHQNSGNEVKIINASKMVIPLKKQQGKVYVSYSGYPGGKKEKTLQQILKDKGIEEVVTRAVYGMLPVNKLRKGMMKNLTVIK